YFRNHVPARPDERCQSRCYFGIDGARLCEPRLAGRPGVAARRDRGTAMTPQEWERVKQIFDLALAEPADRARFLQSQCGEDSHIRSEVERLLAEHERASGFLEPPSSDGDRFGLSGSQSGGTEAPLIGQKI